MGISLDEVKLLHNLIPIGIFQQYPHQITSSSLSDVDIVQVDWRETEEHKSKEMKKVILHSGGQGCHGVLKMYTGLSAQKQMEA